MIDSLRHLLLIERHGTFTAAARAAHLSQPALTASIQRLEQQIGAALLERGRHGARTTLAGQAFLPFARATLGALADGQAAVAAVTDMQVGEVTIGGGATACTWLLPRTLARFRAEYPGISLRLHEASTHELLPALAAGDVDLGVVTSGTSLPRGVSGTRWRSDALIVVSAPSVGGDAGSGSQSWVAFQEGTPTRALLDRYEPDAQIAASLGSVGAVVALTRAGLGRALVSQVAVQELLASGVLVAQPTSWTPLVRQLDLVYRGSSPTQNRLHPAADALRALLLAPDEVA